MPTAQPDALYQTDPTVGDAARRRIPRFDPGVRGGIPAVADKIVLTPERIAAHPTFAAALNAAIQAVRAPGAVRIPGRPTPYVLTEPIRMRSGVVVRGDGMAQTELHVDIRGDAADVGGSGVRAAVAFEGKAVRTVPLVKAVALAATEVAPDPALFNLADLIGAQLLITQDNDPADGWNTHAWERRVRGQIVQIKAVKTDKLGVDTPIRLAYPMARKPEATLLGAVSGAGLEDLKLYHDPGSHSAWVVAFWYAANCWLKGVEIEPVRGRGHGHDVRAAVRQAAGLGRCHAVAHARVRHGVGDLLRRKIGGMHEIEVLRQPNRRLPVARRAVPGAAGGGRQSGQVGEQRGRVTRPDARVAVGLAREMVFWHACSRDRPVVGRARRPSRRWRLARRPAECQHNGERCTGQPGGVIAQGPNG